jgi:transposase InsO family protein
VTKVCPVDAAGGGRHDVLRVSLSQQYSRLVAGAEDAAECTCMSHAIRVGRRLGSSAVMDTLDTLFRWHGAPAYVRSDNGGEFIAAELKAWLAQRGTETVYIEPGHPWENGVAESFNGKFRDECLNREVFWGEAHAQVIVETWRRTYNEERPHSALGYRTPAEAARALSTRSARTSAPARHQPS